MCLYRVNIKTKSHVCWEACQLALLYVFRQLKVFNKTPYRPNYRHWCSMRCDFKSDVHKPYQEKPLLRPSVKISADKFNTQRQDNWSRWLDSLTFYWKFLQNTSKKCLPGSFLSIESNSNVKLNSFRKK